MTDQTTPLPTTWPELEDTGLLEKIIDIMVEEGAIGREKITPEATLETIGLESMDVVMILMGIEEKLDTYLPMDAQLSAARNLSEFVAAIAVAIKAGDTAETTATEDA